MTLDMAIIEDEMEMKEYPYDLREKVRFEFVSMKELGETVKKIEKIADEMENSTFEKANEWLKGRIENERKKTKTDV